MATLGFFATPAPNIALTARASVETFREQIKCLGQRPPELAVTVYSSSGAGMVFEAFAKP